MGNIQHRATVTVLLSAHNSERDEQHEALWAELQARIKAACEDPAYDDILPMYTGLEPDV